MSKARLVMTAVVVEGRIHADAAEEFRRSRSLLGYNRCCAIIVFVRLCSSGWRSKRTMRLSSGFLGSATLSGIVWPKNDP